MKENIGGVLGNSFDGLFLIYSLFLIYENGSTKYRANYFKVFSPNK